jgi:hypothetical protein
MVRVAVILAGIVYPLPTWAGTLHCFLTVANTPSYLMSCSSAGALNFELPDVAEIDKKLGAAKAELRAEVLGSVNNLSPKVAEQIKNSVKEEIIAEVLARLQQQGVAVKKIDAVRSDQPSILTPALIGLVMLVLGLGIGNAIGNKGSGKT